MEELAIKENTIQPNKLNKFLNSKSTFLQDIGFSNENGLNINFEIEESHPDLEIWRLKVESTNQHSKGPLTIKWKIPSKNIKGVWTTDALHEKRIRADWEEEYVHSRISVDAPIICLYGHDDKNVHTFACADATHKVSLRTSLREEDSCMYCEVVFFSENMPASNYETRIHISQQPVHFSKAIADVRDWWASDDKEILSIPEGAYDPVYSTWYSYHQNLELDELMTQCKIASTMGYKTIIIDDGWQTNDSNRGYDYTGDWRPDRIPEMKAFVDEVHKIGLKVMIWYSVPFCGVKSEAYKVFKGKFLTENHRWAPVFDPRYTEVRNYLIDTYCKALLDWGIDGFKLDFIDDFKVYPETSLTLKEGMDFESVNEAVEQLLLDASSRLKSTKSDVLIEFRQNYIGPKIQSFGNMFRAFDCPNDSLTNRVRTTDVRLLLNDKVVHSDMMEWHYQEEVEIAAIQFLAIIFSVPQISVRLEEIPKVHLGMIRFLTNYWVENREILMNGSFIPHRPSSNYPLLESSKGNKVFYGVYDDYVITIDKPYEAIDIINGKLSQFITLKLDLDLGSFSCQSFSCTGQIVSHESKSLPIGVVLIEVPSSGIIRLRKKK